jgi:hypothetical protein
MDRVYFVDLDGIIVHQGTHELLEGALKMLQKIYESGGRIYYFSCWAFTDNDMNFLKSLVPFEGIIRKPLADEYVYIDDKLRVDLCSNSISR